MAVTQLQSTSNLRQKDDSTSRLLALLNWQRVLFSETSKRSEFNALESSWTLKPLTVRVHRNRPFEFVATTLTTCLMYLGYDAKWEYADYDNSLVSVENPTPVDLSIVWLDYDQYNTKTEPEEFSLWLRERIKTLRNKSAAPILISNSDLKSATTLRLNESLEVALQGLPDVNIIDLFKIRETLGHRYFDERAKRISGTNLSAVSSRAISQFIGFNLVPLALGLPPVKGIVVDLDNTLYEGVLGEDGVGGVSLTPGHEALQRKLVDLRAQGFFIAVCSKNNEDDVKYLFEQRKDFPLRFEDFSAVAISWTGKDVAIDYIAKKLRIGTDALLFLDDNIAELAAVYAIHPRVRCILADQDGASTLRHLNAMPGLYRAAFSTEDLARVNDLRASEVREAMQEEVANKKEYLASLGITLEVASVDQVGVDRARELSHKTNQFNLNFSRFSEVDISGRLGSGKTRVVGVRLRDKLSDSGTIALIVIEFSDGCAVVEEFCISCRALGRDLETLILVAASELAMRRQKVDVSTLRLKYTPGPRNAPAKEWLESFSGEEQADQRAIISVPDWKERFKDSRREAPPVTLIFEDDQ